MESQTSSPRSSPSRWGKSRRSFGGRGVRRGALVARSSLCTSSLSRLRIGEGSFVASRRPGSCGPGPGSPETSKRWRPPDRRCAGSATCARHARPSRERGCPLTGLLDTLDVLGARAVAEAETSKLARQEIAVFGLRLLTDVGYALELDRCVRCGRICPAGRSAFVDAAGGGIVCTSCGGARRTISGELRGLAARAQRAEGVALTRDQAGVLIDVIEDAMAAHADFDPHSR